MRAKKIAPKILEVDAQVEVADAVEEAEAAEEVEVEEAEVGEEVEVGEEEEEEEEVEVGETERMTPVKEGTEREPVTGEPSLRSGSCVPRMRRAPAGTSTVASVLLVECELGSLFSLFSISFSSPSLLVRFSQGRTNT
jgi:hypothetical protein